MAAPHLTAVPSPTAPEAGMDAEFYKSSRGAETGAQRLRRLQEESRALAREQIEALAADLDSLSARAFEIADGGEAYPVGVREMASRIAADLPEKAKSLMVIMDRARRL